MAISSVSLAAATNSSAAASAVCPGERWGAWPSPVGLTLGILAVLVAQLAVIAYHYVRLTWCATRRVQKEARPYDFWEGITSHLANPGGVLMMVAYLCAYWMFDAMPCSYYSFDGGVRWGVVFSQVCCQDLLMFLLHYFEHKGPLGPAFYKKSHKPHHRFVNPRLFDAFDGSVRRARDHNPSTARQAFCAGRESWSPRPRGWILLHVSPPPTPDSTHRASQVPDTFCMILIPLFLTSRLHSANVWEYMAFGASWSSWLCLIHSEVVHPWDPLFRRLGLGTA
eukprot:1856360-Prymnesium_polylepis.1